MAAVGLLALLSGCGVSLPQSGPVVETTTTGSSREDGTVNINPRRPRVGDTPDLIVRGFLDAMTATPAVRTEVAREFLTDQAKASWQPSGMVIYDKVATERGNGAVEVRLDDAHRTDARGAWLGPVSEEDSTYTFSMAVEDGEWRIAKPPPWLMVPQSWFEQRFRQASLYFFEPTATVLVPEPVFVPRGVQFASSLVNGLLRGPATELAATEQNFLPPNLRSVVSVPVSEGGVAQVDLTSDTGDVEPPSAEQADLLVSQLAWTLRQDPTIGRFQVAIDGRPVQLPGEGSEFSVEHGRGDAPYVDGSSSLFFGLRDGLMVGGSPQNLDAVSGPFGSGDYSLRVVAPDLLADQVAGVSATGTTLWLGPVKDDARPVTTLISTGENLLRPAWDFSGRLWVVDRRRSGAVVQFLRRGQMRTLEVPGITGADVKDFLVSRDGTRFVAVIRQSAGQDAIVVSRILTTGDGQVVSALAADDVADPEDLPGQIRDITWRSPTSLVVLHPVSRRLFQARSTSVDGAVGLDRLTVTINQDVAGLVGAPVPGQSVFAFSRGALVDLVEPRGDVITVDDRVSSLGYVG